MEKTLLVIDLQEVIDTIRKNDTPGEGTLSGAFGMAEGRAEEIIDPLDYVEILGKPTSKAEMLARVVEAVQTSTKNSAEAIFLIFQMLMSYHKSVTTQMLKREAFKAMLSGMPGMPSLGDD